ncbi:WXG100 family type VII secretion target [Bhargavaea ginsengi]|uniref:ESAT-6-like protein n=1 Tax=Bhargavaea ginsengi TaxID=426757 RepID=A0A1H6TQ18_9BACL|nr:WXG100 family type VII secretion target [Bhargavaea ginsengi]MCM3087042.1 WXG100 family type VII secretion target [Bhargavaea ginsengi]SEI78350.1 WXG100 family type VII secretion target [Bhargavaea ginsengi]
MSGIIRVTPAELEAMSNRYNNESSEVSAQIGRLDGMIAELQSAWEGASSRAFAEQYERLKPHFIDMQDLLSEIAVQLNRTGHALRDADEQIASQIRS